MASIHLLLSLSLSVSALRAGFLASMRQGDKNERVRSYNPYGFSLHLAPLLFEESAVLDKTIAI